MSTLTVPGQISANLSLLMISSGLKCFFATTYLLLLSVLSITYLLTDFWGADQLVTTELGEPPDACGQL